MLVGGALDGGAGGGEPIVDRVARRLAIKLKPELPGGAARDLEPRAYTDLREREKLMEASEMRRLLYVAATRARDWLVLTCFGALKTQKGEERSGVMLAPLSAALPAPAEITGEYEDGGLLVLPPAEPPAVSRPAAARDVATVVAARDAWQAGRAELLVRAARPALATSPSNLEHIDEQVRSGGPGAPPGRARALALGSAVHRLMELCDLSDEASLARLAGPVALELGDPDLAAEAAALAGACWRAAPVRAAAAAAATDPGTVHRELPVGALVDGVIVNGSIDLLYRDGDEWVIVDYKTDRDPEGDSMAERYAPQGAAYAVALEAAVGGRVREIKFVAARADGLVVTVPVDDELRGLARREVEVAAREARAIQADESAPGAGPSWPVDQGEPEPQRRVDPRGRPA